MKKTFEIIQLKNLLVLALLLSAIAFIGCASQNTATTRSDSTPGKTPDVAARTPENKTELSRLDPLENYDSEEPESYKPTSDSASKTITKATLTESKSG